jgi:raffinose/stachyose/melibiose transport system substrate-binding protein
LGTSVFALTSVPIKGILVNSSITIEVGQSSVLSASFTPKNTTQKLLVYKVWDKNVATVDANGLVTGVSVGKTVITVTSSSDKTISDKCVVTVTQPPQTKITIFYANGDPLHLQLVKDRIDTFMKKYPYYKIEDITITAASYIDGLRTKDAVGEFPDLVEARDVPTWVRAGKFAEMPDELTSLFKDPPLLDGKSYCVPFSSANNMGFFYNKKMFADYSLKEPKTYAEFLSLCDKLKAKGVAPLVVGNRDIFHVGFLWSQYWLDRVTADNPDWIGYRYKGRVHFTDKNVADCFTAYTDLFKKGYVEKGFASTADNQIASVLVSGKAAMFFSGTHMFSQIKAADPNFAFSWFPMPTEDGKINMIGGPQLNGWTYSTACAQDARKKAEAITWIKWFFQKENYTDYVQKMSFIPTTKAQYTLTYPVADMSKVLDAVNTCENLQLQWNNNWGINEIPPAFRNFAYKIAQEWATGSTSIADGLKKLDVEWDIEAKSFRPN